MLIAVFNKARLDPDLAIANVKTGKKVIAAHRDAIPEHLPRLDLTALERIDSSPWP